MRTALRRVGRDLRNRRQLEAYAVATVAVVLAVLSIIEAAVPENLKWAALLVGVGLLVYRVTLPEGGHGRVEDVLLDRSTFDAQPLTERVQRAREVWVFAPSAVNLLSPRNCEALRRSVLSRPDGVLRVVVLDPEAEDGVRFATRQLDDSLDYPVQQLRPSLEAMVRQLSLMRAWPVPGTVEHRLLDYNPGFSLVAIDPSRRDGQVIVEVHGFHNDATHSRMHVELHPSDGRWYDYWLDQFASIWSAARRSVPVESGGLAEPSPG